MPVIDARTLPDASRLEADLVIVGGGMAGLAIAHEFAGTETRVLILESGGLEPDKANQALYEGPAVMSGPGNPDVRMDAYLSQSRIRALGGSGHAWGGKCGPLDEADFARRSWRARSGWPFGRRELKSFYDRACDRLKLPRFPLGDGLPEGQNGTVIGSADGALRSPPRYYSPVSGRVSPAVFAEYRDAPGRAANIAVHLNVNVTAIRLDAKGAVDRLELQCLGGARHIARGRAYILATGGIENARLLLASKADAPRGVGNAHDLVGRCFMGHTTISTPDKDPLGDSEVFVTSGADLALYDNRPRDRAHAVLALDLKAQRQRKAGNCTMTLSLAPKQAAAKGTAARAVEALAAGTDARPAGRRVDYYLMSEQGPDPESRVTLAEQKDALGQPQARLEWRYSEADFASVGKSVDGFGAMFGAQALGRVCWPIGDDTLLARMTPSRHHMGTTRMDPDPKRGVVDADCRVHGVSNLYIAGSSVFPTSGLVNPTLTLIALAIRMSDHLKNKLEAVR